MLFLTLFFLFSISLILLAIPLIKMVLNDYEQTLKWSSEKVKEKQIYALERALNQTVKKRWQELEEHFTSPTNQLHQHDLLMSLKVYLQSILKIFKSEESTL